MNNVSAEEFRAHLKKRFAGHKGESGVGGNNTIGVETSCGSFTWMDNKKTKVARAKHQCIFYRMQRNDWFL